MNRSWAAKRNGIASLALVMALAGSVGASCSSETPSPTNTIAAMPLQPAKRFPIGATFYLPNPTTGT